MAKKMRTSARMLVYHFGSREGLMRKVLMGIREREDSTIRKLVSQAQDASNPDRLSALVLAADGQC